MTRSCRTRRRLAWLGGLALVVGAVPLRAASFDEATGRVTLDPAAYAISFDSATSLPAELAPVLLDRDGVALSAELMAQRFVADAQGLEGDGSMELGGDFATLQLSLSGLASRFTGRRVEIRFWQRPQGTRLTATLTWAFVSATDPDDVQVLGSFPLQPTGRATDDGWQEWTSGPVDFAAGGEVAPALLELTDVQQRRTDQLVTFDRQLRVRLDALEILDLGPAAVPAADCSRLSQALDCGPQGACLLGRCVDAALRYGPLLVDPTLRGDFLSRRLYEFAFFEGGRLPQSLMGSVVEAVQTMQTETSAARFWPRLGEAVGALRDGHASSPSYGTSALSTLTNLGVCLHLGEADLEPRPGPAPLVFSVDGDNPVADELQVGDVVVAIDGLPPFDWARLAGLTAHYDGDPAGFDLEVAPSLLLAAWGAGSTVTLHRCEAVGVPEPCDASEVQTVEVDLGRLARETFWAGDLPDWRTDSQTCDYRFRRALNDPGVREYTYAGYADDGPVRTLIINGVPDVWSEAPDWLDTVVAALNPPPAYLIFDQRYAPGGSVWTTDRLMGMLLTDQDFDRMEIVPQLDEPLDATAWAELTSCQVRNDTNDCGGYLRWALQDYSHLSTDLRGVAGATRVAVLNGLDASGNDFTSRLFTFRAAPTRIFSGAPTFGAFGPRYDLPGHLDETWGGSFQMGDTVFVAHPAEPIGEFTTGIGVPPDEWILQRQSDALLGVDTTVEAARAWLLAE